MTPTDEAAAGPALGPVEAEPAGVETEGPSSEARVRQAYRDHATNGYMVYVVGATSAFLAVSLGLSDAQAGMHSSALAVGVVTSGLAGDRLDRRFGVKAVHIGAVLSLFLAVLLLGSAAAFAVTLAGALAVGLGQGLLLGHVNRTVTAGGGSLGRMRLARSSVFSMVAGMTVPLFIGLGVVTGFGWQLALVPALALIAIAFVSATRRLDAPVPQVVTGPRLPSLFWLAWSLILLVVAIEFAVVFWGSSLLVLRSGVPLASATLALSAFVGGMMTSRIALSNHVIASRDPVQLMRGGIVLAFTATLLVWASASYGLSVLALFACGAGIGALFPLSASMAIAAAPGRSRRASTLVVAAVGLAMLTAPFVLGVAADASDIAAAWALVPLTCIVVLVLTVPLAEARERVKTHIPQAR